MFFWGVKFQQTQRCLPDLTFTRTFEPRTGWFLFLWLRKWSLNTSASSPAKESQLHVDFYFITEGLRPFTAKDYNIFYISIKANFYLRPLLVVVAPQRGRRCRSSLSVGSWKQLETGNGFNRVGLPLSALTQQARRIIQDYPACLWSAAQGSMPTIYLVLPVVYGSESRCGWRSEALPPVAC